MSPQGSKSRLVVVGGDAAGMSAASQAKRRIPELEVIVLEQGRHISYAACGMPYMVSGVIRDPDSLLVLKPEAAREKRGLDVRLGHRVTELDPLNRQVRGRELLGGESFNLDYDRLVLATGARPVIPAVPGVNLNGVFTLRDFQSGLDLKAFLEERRPAEVVIAGAGLIGLEMAESLSTLGARVTVIKRTSGTLLGLEPELGGLVQEELAGRGVTLLVGTPLEAVEDDGKGRVASVRAGGEEINAQMVLVAAGIRPNSELAARAGLALGARGAVAVNERMESSETGVYAAGDCVEQTHLVTGEKVFVSQALAANRQGRVAGANAASSLDGKGPAPTHSGTLGSTIAKVFDLEVGFTGVTVEQARKSGLDAAASVIKSRSRAGYYPGSVPIHVALIFEKGTGRLLGGQMVGREGVAKRLDVIAVGLHAGLNLEQLSRMDLCYAPPFAPAWDPVLVAANVALKKL